MCAILTNYLICNVPAATVLAFDPYARRLSKVQTNLLHININSFLVIQLTIQKCFQQAHIPTYVLAWLSVIINPLLYVLCNPAYRFEKWDFNFCKMLFQYVSGPHSWRDWTNHLTCNKEQPCNSVITKKYSIATRRSLLQIKDNSNSLLNIDVKPWLLVWDLGIQKKVLLVLPQVCWVTHQLLCNFCNNSFQFVVQFSSGKSVDLATVSHACSSFESLHFLIPKDHF